MGINIFNKKEENSVNNIANTPLNNKANQQPNSYKFVTPLVIGINTDGSLKYINEVSFREPTAGDLRGLSLVKIFESDVDSWLILLSRITQPLIHKEFLEKMSLSDTPHLIAKVLGLLGNAVRVEDTQVA